MSKKNKKHRDRGHEKSHTIISKYHAVGVKANTKNHAAIQSLRNGNRHEVATKEISNYRQDVVASQPIELSATVFTSRKRKLSHVAFVKPRVNGSAEPFVFPFRLKTENSVICSPLTNDCGESSGKCLVKESKELVEQNPVALKPLNLDFLKVKNDEDSGISSFSSHQDGQLSGVSMEDAVRDKVGLRPRSNSTDGELKLPQRGLCAEGKVLEAYQWRFDVPSSPKGFRNLGNTCFLNSTLQCLAYLPPFCQSLMWMSGQQQNLNETSGIRKVSNGKKITQILRSLFLRVHGSSDGKVISPVALVNALPTLGSRGSRTGYKFRPGRQEDAHEFLVHLLDSMHDGELKEAGINPDKSGWRDRLPVPRLDETTFIHRTFGGYLRSQLRCANCGYCSNTYDPFLHLSLEISKKSCNSVLGALHEFTRNETLDAMNKWKCPGCKRLVCASKQLTVFRPPLSLCIQFKRFSYGGMGGGFRSGVKITKPIEFPARFNLPLSDSRRCGYTLSGIVVHVGSSASSGHYTAYVKKPGTKDQWFHMDDSFAAPISEKAALREKNAYLLFYSREEVKLEFPAPPLRASMSTEEAQGFNRARAIAKLENVSERRKEDNRILLPHIKKTSEGLCEVRNAKESQGAVSTSEIKIGNDVDDKNKFIKKRTDTGKHEINNSGVKTNEVAKQDTRSIIENFERDSGVDSIGVNSDVELSNLGGLHNHSLKANLQNSSVPADAIINNDIGSSQTSNIITAAKIEMISDKLSTIKGIAEERSPVAKQISKSTAVSDDRKPPGKKVTHFKVDRDGAKVEIVMNPLRKTERAWSHESPFESGSESFGLLGNIGVHKWDDNDDDSANLHKNKSSNANSERSFLVKELEREESARKRRMQTNRWDRVLDQGKKKKVKEKTDSFRSGSASGSTSENPFQLIQMSIKAMNKSRTKDAFRLKNKRHHR